jgi:hypothetical protein
VNLNQSITSHQLLKSKSVYDTSKPRLIYPEEAQQFFPSQRVSQFGPQKKNPACNLVSLGIKSASSKEESPIPTNAELGKMLGEKKRKNAQN